MECQGFFLRVWLGGLDPQPRSRKARNSERFAASEIRRRGILDLAAGRRNLAAFIARRGVEVGVALAGCKPRASPGRPDPGPAAQDRHKPRPNRKRQGSAADSLRKGGRPPPHIRVKATRGGARDLDPGQRLSIGNAEVSASPIFQKSVALRRSRARPHRRSSRFSLDESDLPLRRQGVFMRFG
jgi:hypothetical protein